MSKRVVVALIGFVLLLASVTLSAQQGCAAARKPNDFYPFFGWTCAPSSQRVRAGRPSVEASSSRE